MKKKSDISSNKIINASLEKEGAIILFDGICNFCNASINFIIDRDNKKYFKLHTTWLSKEGQLKREFTQFNFGIKVP